jgi:hypothetical protein
VELVFMFCLFTLKDFTDGVFISTELRLVLSTSVFSYTLDNCSFSYLRALEVSSLMRDETLQSAFGKMAFLLITLRSLSRKRFSRKY